jgi:hypothetical protein
VEGEVDQPLLGEVMEVVEVPDVVDLVLRLGPASRKISDSR